MNRRDYTILYTLGRPLSPLYSAAMKLRALLYQKRIFASHIFDIPVISVGNLTMGGTGKTPMVIYLARLLSDKGFKPAVISRGYRGRAKTPVNIVSDGVSTLMRPSAGTTLSVVPTLATVGVTLVPVAASPISLIAST